MKQIFRGGRGLSNGQGKSDRLNESVTSDGGWVTGSRVTRDELTRYEEIEKQMLMCLRPLHFGRGDVLGGWRLLSAYSLLPKAFLIIFCVLFSAFAVFPVCGQEAVGQSDRTLRGRERSAAHKVQFQIAEPLKIGDTIPDYLWDYKMPLYQGTKIVDSLCLRDYQKSGKVLILDFFTTWCGPCVESVLYVDSMINTYGYDNIKLVPVCILESTSRWVAFAKRVDWQIPTLFDWSYLHNPIQLRYDEQSGLMVIKDGILQGSVIKTSLTKANMDRMNAGQWEGVTLEFKPERDWRTAR